ncbi:vitamin K epoxide reductase family protein [Tenacibaculum sp. XPcli2-G]|uniref:vitamin K epoxide reductase family protein n=1 Tax=Tenacibaculum sp. XPcli2-G TaxID=2954503 RepID=UPI002097A6F7|nr:vitamin K epoxide reductase family protein [Tenacibaculum sp. XPcli2-G]MCO7184272.1 vitamin K epoxide reductase family protein [Tenacibaculum sp. XPcli2-G]
MKLEKTVSDVLLKYIKKSRITINVKEFSYRLKTHPKYPSFISVVNTLQYFDIDFSIYKTNIEDIDNNVTHFFTMLKNEQNQMLPSLIEIKNKKLKANSVNISKEKLNYSWTEIILILNEKKQRKVNQLLTIGILFTFLSFTFIYFKVNIFDFAYFILIILGLILSIFAVRFTLKFNDVLAKKICNISTNGDCDSVINNKKWKLFEIINFADLSFVFFISQIFTFLLAFIFKHKDFFISFNFTLLILSIPFIITSIYYQKFIENKWCTLCLGIIITLTLEAFTIIIIKKNNSIYNFRLLLTYISVFLIMFFLWKSFKKLLVENATLLNSKIKTNRFLNNYQVFKAILKTGKKINYTLDYLSFPKSKPKLTFTLVTDPFCEYCRELHYQLLSILKEIDDVNYHINVVFNINVNEETKEDKLLYLTMTKLQQTKGNQFFFNELHEWYNHENVELWLKNNCDERMIDKSTETILLKQQKWCSDNQINYTPALFINRYEFPFIYEIEHLNYFIDDFIDD